jgi:hypothetical protein
VFRGHDAPHKCDVVGGPQSQKLDGRNPSVVISLDYEWFIELQGAKEAFLRN